MLLKEICVSWNIVFALTLIPLVSICVITHRMLLSIPFISSSFQVNILSSMRLFIAASLIVSTAAFYLPGLAPVNFCEKQNAHASCPVCFTFTFTVLTWVSLENILIFSQMLFSINIYVLQSNITMYVNRLDSDQSVIPFEYHRQVKYIHNMLWVHYMHPPI